MLSRWKKVVVSLVVATVFIGTSTTVPLVGKHPDVEPMADDPERELTPEFIWDMNGVSWKDADSTYTDDLDRMMYAREVVMWNDYDYVEVSWFFVGWGRFEVEAFCYGEKPGIMNFIRLEVIVEGQVYVQPHHYCPDYGRTAWWRFDIFGTEYQHTFFRFYNEVGYNRLDEVAAWQNDLIRITHWAKGIRTFGAYDMKFVNADSCYYNRPDCPNLHNHVHNYVPFLDGLAYLKTRTFTPSMADPDMKITLHNRCLVAQCSADLWVNGQYILTHTWPESLGPWLDYEEIGGYVSYTGTQFFVEIKNGENSEFVWDEVIVDVL